MSIRDDGFDLDAIRRINNTVVNADGTVKSFKEQLLEYEYGYYNAFLPFIVYGDSRAIAQSGASNLPIVMNASVLAKLKQKHDLVPMEIAELPKMMLENNVIMMDSYTVHPGGLVMYLDTVGIHDAPLFVAFHLDQKSGEVSVNRLASVYERANIEYTICKTWEMGLNLYPNEKTENWLKSLGLQLPDNLASFLTGDYRAVSKDTRIPVDPIISDSRPPDKTPESSYSLRSESVTSRDASKALNNGPSEEHSRNER